MDIAQVMERSGGLATRASLIVATSRREVDIALRTGAIRPVARGRYALPAVEEAAALAHRVSGVRSHSSAALHHGWEVLRVPKQPHITVRRSRRLSEDQLGLGTFHYVDLLGEDLGDDRAATNPEVTLLQCLRSLPEDEGLAIADSALRHGLPPSTLRRIAASVTGPGSAKVRRLCAAAREEADNPFESGLRSIALQVPGLAVEPQVVISEPGVWARPDLVDRERRIVLEADSFEWHGGRQALAKDARRYNLLVVNGWHVLRFAWEDVMFDADYVHATLVSLVAHVDRQAQLALGLKQVA